VILIVEQQQTEAGDDDGSSDTPKSHVFTDKARAEEDQADDGGQKPEGDGRLPSSGKVEACRMAESVQRRTSKHTAPRPSPWCPTSVWLVSGNCANPKGDEEQTDTKPGEDVGRGAKRDSGHTWWTEGKHTSEVDPEDTPSYQEELPAASDEAFHLSV
jgi:hypothetical protein